MINMGVPVLVGVCQQASGGGASKTLTIGSITFSTTGYGTTTSQPINPIPEGEALTTTLSGDNSFTFPTDSLAQFYSNSDPTQQVFTGFNLAWTADNFVENDLPSDGENQIEWQVGNFSPATPNTGIWFLEGDDTGQIIPPNAKFFGAKWNTGSDLNRADVWETAPFVGNVTSGGIPIQAFILNSEGTNNNNTDRINKLAVASTASSGSTTTFDLTVRVLLKTGEYATGTQTITVPSDAVKTNLTTAVQPTVTQVQTQALLSTPFDNTLPQTPLDPADQLICTIATGEVADPLSMIYQTSGTTSASHSFRLRFDTAGLTASDFPEEMIVRYVITASGYDANEIGFLTEDIFSQTCVFDGQDRSAIITGGLVFGPVAINDNDTQFKITTDLNSATWNVKVELQKNDGSFLASPDFAVVMASDTVINL